MHTIRARVLGPEDGEVAGGPGFRRDRFMVDGADTGSRLSVVEHTLGPRVLAGPLHFHTREDEFSFVLEGRLEAGEEPTRILELITPAGLRTCSASSAPSATTSTRRRSRRWPSATGPRSTSRARRP